MEVLISIKPQYVEKIISGEKTIELRKNIFKKQVKKVTVPKATTRPVAKKATVVAKKTTKKKVKVK